jgi:hypothetical protein
VARLREAEARKTYDELSKFVAQQDVVDSIERAAKDKRLLRKAKANPKAYLEADGHRLPANTQVKILQQRVQVSGTITLCVQVCRQVGPFLFCVQICITVVFQT